MSRVRARAAGAPLAPRLPSSRRQRGWRPWRPSQPTRRSRTTCGGRSRRAWRSSRPRPGGRQEIRRCLQRSWSRRRRSRPAPGAAAWMSWCRSAGSSRRRPPHRCAQPGSLCRRLAAQGAWCCAGGLTPPSECCAVSCGGRPAAGVRPGITGQAGTAAAAGSLDSQQAGHAGRAGERRLRPPRLSCPAVYPCATLPCPWGSPGARAAYPKTEPYPRRAASRCAPLCSPRSLSWWRPSTTRAARR